ncbi:hypothetical protein HAHE_39860 [Haloferula helveola]|uniref:Metallo-beta-lactamase domain-containing protein n=1 Tax=Haloferula helveola TaxID=490095 RepID=A0ABM7RKC2_9BACT|nr:hypothetical protein HAHE_39860 [Haloferula helveola]
MKIYDAASDIVAKAMRGQGLLPCDLSGVDSKELGAFLKGEFEPALAEPLATALKLDGPALARYQEAFPEPELPAGVTRIELPFEDDTVNAWALRSGATLLVVDAGLGSTDLASALPEEPVSCLLITHPHRDHIGGISGVRSRVDRLVAPVSIPDGERITAGDQVGVGAFRIEAFSLAGHHPDALGYRIDWPGGRCVAVGDAVFAGSAGGCPDLDAYAMARRTIAEGLGSVPNDVVLLTGHGQATTLGVERSRNPFLARWLAGSATGS